MTSLILRQQVCEENTCLISHFPLNSPTPKADNILVVFYIIIIIITIIIIKLLYHISAHSWTALYCLHSSLPSSYIWTLISQELYGPKGIIIRYQPDEARNKNSDPFDWGILNTGAKSTRYMSYRNCWEELGTSEVFVLFKPIQWTQMLSNQTCCQAKLKNSQFRKCQGSGGFVGRFIEYLVQTRLLLGLFLEMIVSSHACWHLIIVQGTAGVEDQIAGIGLVIPVGSHCIRPTLKRSATWSSHQLTQKAHSKWSRGSKTGCLPRGEDLISAFRP